jgi:hypothetical protein
MTSKVSIIAWVSKERSPLLERSIAGFRGALEREKLSLRLCVAGAALDHLDSIDKPELCDRLIEATKGRGVPAEVIRFALLGDAEIEVLSVRNTGANRNALLLNSYRSGFPLC